MIKYSKGAKYKYQLEEDYTIATDIIPTKYIKTTFIELTLCGVLTIKKGYNWDGATCAIDTVSILRGSLVHDCGYQMLQEGLLSKKYRKPIDKLFIRICKEDGMCWARRKWVYAGVRTFGGIFSKVK